MQFAIPTSLVDSRTGRCRFEYDDTPRQLTREGDRVRRYQYEASAALAQERSAS